MPDSRAGRQAEEHLGQVQMVADASLAHLDVDELLAELLDRTIELLDADTAVVLLLDRAAGELVATAARGIEEEVHQGVRVPLGRGFAGTIAGEARPMVLHQIDETTVWNPILWEKGVRSLLGVPLMAGGEVIGVLHAGTLSPRRFTDRDGDLLQLAAERVAVATRLRLTSAERTAAQLLQRSLLPAALPIHPELEFAARYVPAEHSVGGDWYDVFTLPSGDVWVVSGDVAGHGIDSAVVMGRLRTTIRAHAFEGLPPNRVIELADRSMHHFETDPLATVVCAVARPPFDAVSLASAGHLPPVLAAPGAPAVLVEVDTGPPLGTNAPDRASCQWVPLTPGSVMFFYTDGLIERRDETLDAGLARVRTVVSANSPHVVCHRVMQALIGADRPPDDVAILAVRRRLD